MKKSKLVLIALSFFAFTLISCYTSRVVVHKQSKKPPRPTTILVPASVPKPGPSYVWVDGYYKWDKRSGKYLWVKGHWKKGKKKQKE